MGQHEGLTHVTLVDAHVHFHPCFSAGAFLDSAVANFSQAAVRVAPSAHVTGILMLTEPKGRDWFSHLAEVGPGRENGWQIERTLEAESLLAKGPAGQRLVIVSGRQVVTEDRLEVLWLGTRSRPSDGGALSARILQARDDGAVAVIPWGFGKWLGRRGESIAALVADDGLRGAFHLGDNGGRPAFWPEPRWFRQIVEHGGRVLPGTDPLPFASETHRPGSFGFYWVGRLGEAEPCRELKALIGDSDIPLGRYGRGERPHRFVRNQLAMQWRRREPRREVA